jgi:hypothetical protein
MLTRRRNDTTPSPIGIPGPDVDEVAGFKSERWPLSNRNGGRLQIGMVADITSEQAAALRRNLQTAGRSTSCLR